jgi:hypothetical protein
MAYEDDDPKELTLEDRKIKEEVFNQEATDALDSDDPKEIRETLEWIADATTPDAILVFDYENRDFEIEEMPDEEEDEAA